MPLAEETGNLEGSHLVEGMACRLEDLVEQRRLGGKVGKACHDRPEVGSSRLVVAVRQAFRKVEVAFLSSFSEFTMT